MKTTGNTILITGGTSGLGLGLALRFHRAGNTVIVAGRRRERLDTIVAENPAIASVVLDVTDPASITSAFEAVTSAHPELNVLINNAGIMLPEVLLEKDSLRVAEDTVTTNLLGPIRMNNLFAPFLAAKDDGVIINVTSGLAYVPLPLTPTYSATKSGLNSYTDALRVQLRETPVQVIELVPPALRTTLMNQEDRETAMPLEDYLDEVMGLFASQPDAQQIIVERVKLQRFAEARGDYDKVLSMLAGPRT